MYLYIFFLLQNTDNFKEFGKSPTKGSIGSSDTGKQSVSKDEKGDISSSQTRHTNVNGNVQRIPPSGSTSPAAIPALKRQETLRSKFTCRYFVLLFTSHVQLS